MLWFTRAAFVASVATAQVTALVLGVLLVLTLGVPVGLILAVTLGLLAPIASALAVRPFVRRRVEVSVPLVAAPVWLVVAAMSRMFTSFRTFVDGDSVRPDRLSIIVAAAAVGAILAVAMRTVKRPPRFAEPVIRAGETETRMEER